MPSYFNSWLDGVTRIFNTMFNTLTGEFHLGRMLREDGSIANLADTINAGKAIQVNETVRFAAIPCAADPIRVGPEAGLSANYDTGWLPISGLSPYTGMKPGTLALAIYIATLNTGAANTLTISGSYDSDGTRVVAAIAKSITNQAATTWVTDTLAAIQYCPYIRVQFTLAGNGNVFAYVTGEGAKITAVAV